MCLSKNEAGRQVCTPESCPYAKGYYDRLKTALASLLDGEGQLDRPALEAAAQQFTVCPFELGLDLSDWCDLIIGDYNYLFDPTVRLRRFFEGGSGDWVFLIDEAHNLPDRAREIVLGLLLQERHQRGQARPAEKQTRHQGPADPADKELLALRRACEALAPRKKEKAEEETPAAKPQQPEQLACSMRLTSCPCQDCHPCCRPARASLCRGWHCLFEGPVRCCGAAFPGAAARPAGLAGKTTPRTLSMSRCWTCIFRSTISSALRSGTTATMSPQLTAHGSDLTLRLLCLDPSDFVDESMACGRTTVLFSAT